MSNPISEWMRDLLEPGWRAAEQERHQKMRELFLALPPREEFLGGQRFQYIKKADAIDLIDANQP